MAALIEGGSYGERPDDEARFASPHAAYRIGVESLANDDVARAVPALEFAADRGVLGAQLRLARLYSSDETYRSRAKALTYYHMIVNEYGDVDRLHPVSRHVAEALRNLSRFYRDGVPEIGLQPDARRAAQLMRDAASYFRDPRAQFEIGRMYAEGDGVARSRRLAASWLLKASQKRYAPAQAYLGEMLWQADANDRLRAQGLALLVLAMNNADDAQRARIEARYREMGQDAQAAVIKQAEHFVAAWDSFRTKNALQTATAQLRALRSTPLEAAPVGSLVVSVSDDSYVAGGEGAVGTLMRDIRLYLPYDMVASDVENAGASIAPHPMEKFVRGQPALGEDDTRHDITTVEINRYGGEMLSVGADAPTQ
ncbi:tetratricopeptide repeat protein [Dichotomicrobium thermohalophilum]|uniref:tetratricopeptide repeat protein n=1 Tax=Dichotomicrobium thermohalophilum TaxID=933063 RepID=UPI0011C21111|nr:tetratricopeptide repeat protein [Dichotomicrobium thermohalophilum]